MLGADSGASRPAFRDEADHDSGMIRTHGGVAGVGRRPPPLCRSNRVPRIVKKLVACIMPSTIFDRDGIPASGGLLLSTGSAMARNYNPRTEAGTPH